MNTLVDDAKQHGSAVGLSVDRITINGGKPLNGRIELKGAKNLVTKAMVAAILGDTPSVLKDVPNISDVRIVRGLLEVHGVSVTEGVEEGELILDPSGVATAHMADIDAHAGSSRIPILFCGPLLHRLGPARSLVLASALSAGALLVGAAGSGLPNAPIIVLAVTLLAVAFGIGQPALNAAVGGAVKEPVRGVALGIGTLVFLVGASVGSAVIGGLGDLVGIGQTLAMLAVLPVLGGLLVAPTRHA